MPQSRGIQTVNNFIGGLNTEAGFLNFPDGASADLSNVVLNKDGSVKRRLGINFEQNYTVSPFTSTDDELKDFGRN